MTTSVEPLSTQNNASVKVAETICFHCHLPVPPNTHFFAVIDGQRQPMCCHGCQAVAEAIMAAGLTDFYRHRTASSRRAEDLIPEQLRGLTLYDRPDLQRSFVRIEDTHVREAALILEGIVCAACVWLNERHINALPGVLEFRVNYSTHRARLRWDDRHIKLSDVLNAIAAIGYIAHPFDPGRQEALQKRERAVALRRLAVAGLFGMQVMMLTVGLYVGEHQGMEVWIRDFLRWICLILTTPVVIYAARPFFDAAWRDLQRRQLGMDVPVSLAIVTAFIASIGYTRQGGGEVYYDSVTMFTFFLLTGRFLEMSARHHAGQVSEALVRMLPATAARLGRDNEEEIVAVAELQPKDRVLVRPGETIPADGRIEEGSSSVDESLLSGESLPLTRKAGEVLIGGSVNIESPLIMRVEKIGADTVLSAIVRLLDRAQSERPRLSRLADQIAGWFVAGLLVVASIVFLVWWRLAGFDTAFRITLSVLVVTCPCALSLATPTAIVAATGALTRRGILTTRGHALETLAQATHVIFDKTGTLTYGRLRVTAVDTAGCLDSSRCLLLAAALERGSEHPVGRALVDAAGQMAGDGACAPVATALCNTPGGGIEGWVDSCCYRVGHPEFVAQLSGSVIARSDLDASSTRVVLGDSQGVLAWFKLEDTLRPGAAEMGAALQARGLAVELLSGDRQDAVTHIAHQVMIDKAIGGLSPQDKLDRVRALQQRGAVVVMVGDGVNDAPVLAAAQVSLAMGEGTQLAHATADMILLSEDLSHLVYSVDVARRTLWIMRENFLWAIGYNLIALPLAAGGYLTPWMSALGMSFSSLLVVVNALRLRQSK
ncbi:MAG: cation transporter [Candidatus Contendobacter odensis]|uniref:Cation transporter n=1 Tax=Candidatus Contendibacter odensensis TaxID=1400860 RepID=A0A2G6PE65_9GAMM|nr:MAG: cation transporter [Candidatus Contendobacter odensis]